MAKIIKVGKKNSQYDVVIARNAITKIRLSKHLKSKNRSIYLYVDPKNVGAMKLYKKFNFKLIKSEGIWGDKYKFIP